MLLFLQIEEIAAHTAAQSWDGLEIVHDLPGRGRGVKVNRPFLKTEVVCSYPGELLSHKDGKSRYMNSQEAAMGYMFEFRHAGQTYWVDATKEAPGPGRLVNHSRCHANVGFVQINFLSETLDYKLLFLKL